MKLRRFFYNRVIRPIITVHDKPEPVALGVFIGIFIGTTPTIGLQIPLAIILAAIFRANKIAAAAMTWPANPLTMVPLYWFQHYVGAKMLGKETLHFADIQKLVDTINWTNWWQIVARDLFWPLMFGGFVVSIIFATPWYPLSLWLLRIRRRRIDERMARILAGRRLVLASASARRQRLVREWGYNFEVVEPNIRTAPNCKTTPVKTALHNARFKAKKVAAGMSDAIVVAAETLTVYQGKAYGKPNDEADAIRMLRELSGTRHAVITAICAIDTGTGRIIVDHDEVVVHTHKMTDEQIQAFVKETGLSRTGPYKVQIENDNLIKRNDGHIDTVIGFPRYIFERMMPRLLKRKRNVPESQAAHKASA
jgi:septum formation protein